MTNPIPGRRMFCLCLLVAMMAPAVDALAQTTADDLYFSVQRFQKSLGENAVADRLRDRLLIRELETESAKGFTADPEILQRVASQLASEVTQTAELASVASALDAHLQSLNQSNSVDVTQAVSGLSTKLHPVELSALSQSKDNVLDAIDKLNAWHESELSYFGRHYINKRLGISQLQKSVAELKLDDFSVDKSEVAREDGESDEDYAGRLEQLNAEKARQFNRDLNTFRQQMAQARQLFGLASASWDSDAMTNAEAQITALEEQSFAYLLYQSRNRPAFEENLQRRKQAFVARDGSNVDNNDRLYQAELGRWLGLLGQRDQVNGLDAAVRRDFSKPNFVLSIQESLANRLGGQPVSQTDPVDEVIVGSRAQGWSYTSGRVSVDFVDSPYSALVRVNLKGSIDSSAYTREGPVTAYTHSNGDFQAERDVRANVGNVSVFEPRAWARISSQFLGTDCIPLVTRIASRRFSERQQRAEEVSSEKARARLLGQFTEQTDEALGEGLGKLTEARSRQDEFLNYLNELRQDISQILAEDQDGNVAKPYDLVDRFRFPRIFVNTTESVLQIGGVLEGDNRLAAPSSPPAPIGPVDFRLQIHESLISNSIAPAIQNRLIENWQFRNLVESLSSGQAEMPDSGNDRPFAIRFEDARPVQIEFEDNELGVTVFGKEFRQERNRFTDPISIHVRFRVVNDKGELKLVRSTSAKVDFTYDPLEGKTLSPESIAFRQFLQDNLDEALNDEAANEPVLLPVNLLPLDFIDDTTVQKQLQSARLVECSAENGWLTLGWNYVEGDQDSWTTVNTPAIWQDMPNLETSTDVDSSSDSIE